MILILFHTKESWFCNDVVRGKWFHLEEGNLAEKWDGEFITCLFFFYGSFKLKKYGFLNFLLYFSFMQYSNYYYSDIFLTFRCITISTCSFWNFDALFQPQQHPARDSHDTFFLKGMFDLISYLLLGYNWFDSDIHGI
jgi:hypothetical protein